MKHQIAPIHSRAVPRPDALQEAALVHTPRLRTKPPICSLFARGGLPLLLLLLCAALRAASLDFHGKPFA